MARASAHRKRTLWVVVLFAVCGMGCAWAPSAWAQDWSRSQVLGLNQPDVVSRSVLGAPLFHLYISPDHSGAVDGASLRRVATETYRAAFDSDPRFAFSARTPGDISARAKQQQSEEDRGLIRQLEVGHRLYRMGNLREATSVLRGALEDVDTSAMRWSDTSRVAQAWKTLALAYQELAASEDAPSMELKSRTRLALRAWIRLRPDARVDGARYPRSFVDAWRQAYFAQVVSSAAVLSIRLHEAQRAAALVDADIVADIRVTRSPRGGTIAVRVFDRVSNLFAYDAILPWTGTRADLQEKLSRAFSVARACIPLERPEPTRARIFHSNYLSAGALLFAFTDRPTHQAFINSGFRLAGHHYVTRAVGFYADLSVTFSRRDRAGQLLEPIQVQSVSAGASFQYERPRVRLFFDVGVEASRRSAIAVTSSFWCRVSGGAAVRYDGRHRCDGADVFRQRPSGLVGVRIGAGLGVKIAGPVWWQLAFTSTMYLLPFDNRGVDRPVGGSTGLVYKF